MNWIYSLFICTISLSATPLSHEMSVKKYFVVWNVGQGQWTSLINPIECWHYDMGGEFFAWSKINKFCGQKTNRVSLSHWDWDHIGGLRKASKYLKNLCLNDAPLGNSTPGKMKLLPAHVCIAGEKKWKWQPTLNPKAGSNEQSQVFITDGFLLPGDSTQKEEPQWAKALPKTERIRVLILGHHGSRTSTSDFLLSRIPKLKLAVASARWRRYHHPHAQVLASLQKHKIPILRTEDWGSLWFEL